MIDFQNEFTPEDCLGRTLFCGMCGTLSLEEKGEPAFQIPIKVCAVPRFSSQFCDIANIDTEFFPPLFDLYKQETHVKAVLTLPLYNTADHSIKSATRVGSIVYECSDMSVSNLVACTRDQNSTALKVHETMSFDLDQVPPATMKVSFLKMKEDM